MSTQLAISVSQQARIMFASKYECTLGESDSAGGTITVDSDPDAKTGFAKVRHGPFCVLKSASTVLVLPTVKNRQCGSRRVGY